jgi:hypothetical protein
MTSTSQQNSQFVSHHELARAGDVRHSQFANPAAQTAVISSRLTSQSVGETMKERGQQPQQQVLHLNSSVSSKGEKETITVKEVGRAGSDRFKEGERERGTEKEEVKAGITNNPMNITFTSNSFETSNIDKVSYTASASSPPSSASSLSSASSHPSSSSCSSRSSSSHHSRSLSLGSLSPVVDQLTAHLTSSSETVLPSALGTEEEDEDEVSPLLTATAILTVHSSANSSVASKESNCSFGLGDHRSHSALTSMKERHLHQIQESQLHQQQQGGVCPIPPVYVSALSSSSVHSSRSHSLNGSQKEADDNVSSSTGNWSFSYILQHGNNSSNHGKRPDNEKLTTQGHRVPFKEGTSLSRSRSYDEEDGEEEEEEEEERDSLDLIQLAKMDS